MITTGTCEDHTGKFVVLRFKRRGNVSPALRIGNATGFTLPLLRGLSPTLSIASLLERGNRGAADVFAPYEFAIVANWTGSPGSFVAKLGVAEAVRNRRNDDGAWPNLSNYQEVDMQGNGGQFNGVLNPNFNNAPALMVEKGRQQFLDCISASLMAHCQNTNRSNRAEFFYSPYIPLPDDLKTRVEVFPFGVNRLTEFRFFQRDRISQRTVERSLTPPTGPPYD